MTVLWCVQGSKGALHMASLDATMWAEGNASSCIEAGTCLPLGTPSLPRKRAPLWFAKASSSEVAGPSKAMLSATG